MGTLLAFIISLIIAFIVIAISFSIVSLIAGIICWCLGIAFTPKIAIIAYLIWLLIGGGPTITITNNAKDKYKIK